MFQSVEETECRTAYNRAAEVYISSFDKSKPPEAVRISPTWCSFEILLSLFMFSCHGLQAALREAHEEAVQTALSFFNSHAVGAGSARQKYEMLLQNCFRKEFEVIKVCFNTLMVACLAHCASSLNSPPGKENHSFPFASIAIVEDVLQFYEGMQLTITFIFNALNSPFLVLIFINFLRL